MRNTHLYLIGYRGCGKTTVGRLIAQKLSAPFFDADDVIEQSASQTIAEIFASEGEAGFRQRETDALKQIATGPPAIISLGGGAILRAENRAIIARTGRTAWLQASAAALAERIAGDTTTAARRPRLTQLGDYDEIVALLAKREPLYREVASKSFHSQYRIPDEICDEIVSWFLSNDETEPIH